MLSSWHFHRHLTWLSATSGIGPISHGWGSGKKTKAAQIRRGTAKRLREEWSLESLLCQNRVGSWSIEAGSLAFQLIGGSRRGAESKSNTTSFSRGRIRFQRYWIGPNIRTPSRSEAHHQGICRRAGLERRVVWSA